MQALVDPLYLGPVVFLPLAVLCLVRLSWRRTRGMAASALAALALAAVAVAPVYAGYLAVRSSNPGLQDRTPWPNYIWQMRLPWALLNDAASVVPLVPVLIAAGLLALLVHARLGTGMPALAPWRHAALWTVLSFVLSMGPRPSWFDRPFTAPLMLVAPGLVALFRVASRLAIPAMIGLALLAGLTFAAVVRLVFRKHSRHALVRAAPPIAALLFAGTMYVEYRGALDNPAFNRAPLPASYPIAEAPAPYPRTILIGLRLRQGPLLDLPIGEEGTRPAFHAHAMYRSIGLWHPLLNGYTSYWPAGFQERMALANRLPDAAALTELRKQTGLALIVVHIMPYLHPPDREWLSFAVRGGRPDLRYVKREGNFLLYAVRD
jgi:hypothetical protein